MPTMSNIIYTYCVECDLHPPRRWVDSCRLPLRKADSRLESVERTRRRCAIFLDDSCVSDRKDTPTAVHHRVGVT